MPRTDTKTLTFTDGNITSFKVYDSGGKSGKFDDPDYVRTDDPYVNVIEFLVDCDTWYKNPHLEYDPEDGRSWMKYDIAHSNPGENGFTGEFHLEWAGKHIVKAVNLRK